MTAKEYDAARSSAVIADRSDRSFIRVHGRDPVRMIQGLVSNDIADGRADRAVYATVLTPKGKMVADVRIVRLGDDLLLETDAGAAEPLTAHLTRFVPPLFARFEDANDAWCELGVYGPRAADIVNRVFGVDASIDANEDDLVTGSFGESRAIVIATRAFDVPGFDVIIAADAHERARRALIAEGALQAGPTTLDVLRIEAGTPRWGAELIESTIPLEAGLRERAISETKGCYTGQEVIVRILHRGHVNWTLRGVLLGDAASPAPETALLSPADGRKVGRITSAAWSPKFGQTIALAYVRREVEPGSDLRLESGSGSMARVVELPFTPPDAEPDF